MSCEVREGSSVSCNVEDRNNHVLLCEPYRLLPWEECAELLPSHGRGLLLLREKSVAIRAIIIIQSVALYSFELRIFYCQRKQKMINLRDELFIISIRGRPLREWYRTLDTVDIVHCPSSFDTVWCFFRACASWKGPKSNAFSDRPLKFVPFPAYCARLLTFRIEDNFSETW